MTPCLPIPWDSFVHMEDRTGSSCCVMASLPTTLTPLLLGCLVVVSSYVFPPLHACTCLLYLCLAFFCHTPYLLFLSFACHAMHASSPLPSTVLLLMAIIHWHRHSFDSAWQLQQCSLFVHIFASTCMRHLCVAITASCPSTFLDHLYALLLLPVYHCMAFGRTGGLDTGRQEKGMLWLALPACKALNCLLPAMPMPPAMPVFNLPGICFCGMLEDREDPRLSSSLSTPHHSLSWHDCLARARSNFRQKHT